MLFNFANSKGLLESTSEFINALRIVHEHFHGQLQDMIKFDSHNETAKEHTDNLCTVCELLEDAAAIAIEALEEDLRDLR